MENKLKLVFITSSKVPSTVDAQAQRVFSYYKMLENSDFLVYSNCIIKPIAGDFASEKMIRFKSYKTNDKSNLFSKVIERLFRNRFFRKELSSLNMDVLIFNDFPASTIKVFKEIGRLKGARLIYDAVEWYSASQFTLGRLSWTLINNNLVNSKIIDKSINVVSISRYFNDYYSDKSINTIYVPVILDKNNYSVRLKSGLSPIKLIYAGYMGKKDSIKLFFDAFKKLDALTKTRFEITIVGPSSKELETHLDGSNIKFLNFMSHERLIELYRTMDFSILFRNPIERYAKAGFPTKVAESMMCGVPVICNKFSNLDDYLVDSINSFMMGYTENEIINRLVEISGLDNVVINRMKLEARSTAERYFDYREYSNKLSEFVLVGK